MNANRLVVLLLCCVGLFVTLNVILAFHAPSVTDSRPVSESSSFENPSGKPQLVIDCELVNYGTAAPIEARYMAAVGDQELWGQLKPTAHGRVSVRKLLRAWINYATEFNVVWMVFYETLRGAVQVGGMLPFDRQVVKLITPKQKLKPHFKGTDVQVRETKSGAYISCCQNQWIHVEWWREDGDEIVVRQHARAFAKQHMLPTKTACLDGIKVNVPRNALLVLDQMYRKRVKWRLQCGSMSCKTMANIWPHAFARQIASSKLKLHVVGPKHSRLRSKDCIAPDWDTRDKALPKAIDNYALWDHSVGHERAVLKTMIEVIDEFAQLNGNHQWMLAFGTLMGCVRYNGMTPWDDDLDLWIPQTMADEIDSNVTWFNERGMHVSEFWGGIRFTTTQRPEEWPFVDCFTYTGDKRWGWYVKQHSVKHPHDRLFPLSMQCWDGLSVPIPRNPLSVLDIFYGRTYSDYVWREWCMSKGVQHHGKRSALKPFRIPCKELQQVWGDAFGKIQQRLKRYPKSDSPHNEQTPKDLKEDDQVIHFTK